MTEPCKQAENIGGLKATNEAIQGTLERLLDGQERFIHILETMSAQGTEIVTLKTNQDELFERVRKTELKSVEQGTRIAMAAGFVSLIIGIVTAYVAKAMGR